MSDARSVLVSQTYDRLAGLVGVDHEHRHAVLVALHELVDAVALDAQADALLVLSRATKKILKAESVDALVSALKEGLARCNSIESK